MTAKVKIEFPITRDPDGFPPFDVEDLWAQTQDGINYTIDNIPFFARQATVGDVVQVQNDGSRLRFLQVVSKSQNSLIRIIVYKDAASRIPDIRSALSELGCATEEFQSYPILAVDIPPGVKLHNIQEYLSELEAEDILTYEEPILRQSDLRRDGNERGSN